MRKATKLLTASFNKFEMHMPLEAVEDCSHSGECDDDVSYWAPLIRNLNPDIKAEDICAELKEYGAWDAKELADSHENWLRIVWCAACNIKEELEA